MRPLREWSIKYKLILMSLVSLGLALGVCCVGITLNEIHSMRAFKMESLEAQAGMLAFNSTGVLSFRDASAAKQLLTALQWEPTVQCACLYDGNGRVLATYPAELKNYTLPPAPTADGCRFRDDAQLEIFRRVMDGGDHVGSIYLLANADDLRAQLRTYGLIMAVVAIAALAISVTLASRLQRSILKPLQQLVRTATQITSSGDYSLRVEQVSQDELGTLCAEVNRMLGRVEKSNRALQNANNALSSAHNELEDRVAERTAALREEIAIRERTQWELLHAKEAAEAANVAKSRFLANMSHEIRTPLNAVIGFTDILLHSAAACTPAEREDYLQIIHTSGKHLLNLINDILDLSKIEADRLQVEHVRCSPHAMIGEIVSLLRVKALEKGLTLDYQWRGEVPETIFTDPARFRQLLMNLVSNAIKFTSAGDVRIVAELTNRSSAPQLTLQVIDTGVGIAPEKFEAIFDPFVQADSSVTRQFGGTGLGLTISRRIAQALGGSIGVASVVNKGSTFTVSIPTGPLDGVRMLAAPAADAMRNARHQPQQPLPSLAGVRVLLAEDGDTNRKLIGLVLERAGALVTMAENGRVGADRALQEPFDLVLMDMQMPVMDGYSATTLLRQAGLTLPIIALTAHAMKGDQDRCLAAGCSGYITKPIDANLLIRTIAQRLGISPPEAAPPALTPPALPAAVANSGLMLYSTLPTDDAEFREIVQEFIDRVHQQIDAMQQALAIQDLAELGRLAHWIKGAGGTAGFPAFTKPAKHLETLIRDQQCDQIEAAVLELMDLSQRIAVCPADHAATVAKRITPSDAPTPR